MDIYELISQMAEQHKSLLKVIDLQNNSIQSINNRLNAMAASQLVIFSLLLELEKADRDKITQHLQMLVSNPGISNNEHLLRQLEELLEICKTDSRANLTDSPKAMPNWFRGIVQGGLNITPTSKKQKD